MSLTLAQLQRIAADAGFGSEPIEKVLRLMELLGGLQAHPYLKERLVLKGGTALNLFLFDVPRLSVDIDLNYAGSFRRDVMLTERPVVEQAIEAVCGRLGVAVKRVPAEHAGGKWRLAYVQASGRPSTLELDVNYMYRVPLWPAVRLDSRVIGSASVTQVSTLDPHELAAGKVAALFGRSASRDLFDARELLRRSELQVPKLRIGFVVYGAMNRRDWRTVSLDDLTLDTMEAEQQLFPLLRSDLVPPKAGREAWVHQLVDECRTLLKQLLPLTHAEREFLDRIYERGEVAPELLTNDARLQAVIREHPGILWKLQNSREA